MLSLPRVALVCVFSYIVYACALHLHTAVQRWTRLQQLNFSCAIDRPAYKLPITTLAQVTYIHILNMYPQDIFASF